MLEALSTPSRGLYPRSSNSFRYTCF